MKQAILDAIFASKKVLSSFGRISPTLGNTSPNSTDRAWLGRHTLAVGGSFDSINFLAGTTSGALTGVLWKGIIYTESGGLPGTLIVASTVGGAFAAAGVVATIAIPRTTLAAGTYWIGGVFTDGSGNTGCDSGGGDGVTIRSCILNTNSYASPSASAGTPTSTYFEIFNVSASGYN